jgi:two-component system sensor histidine kinase TctE
MIMVAVALVWTSIDSTLKPLNQLEAEAATRSGSNLLPLDPAIAPREVRGLILAINRMMKRVFDSIEAQSRFVANAAHQLRTPIAGLRLQAQLAQDEMGTAETRTRLNEIDRSAARAAHVIEQLLTLSRSEAGSIRANFAAVDLPEVAAQVIQRHLPTAVENDVDLGYAGLPGPVLVFGNETLLAELIGNLVDNALRYGRPRGVVTVRIVRKPGTVVLEVIDDGPGIGALSLDTVFNRFQRGDVTVIRVPARPGHQGDRRASLASVSRTAAGGRFRVVVVFPEIEQPVTAMASAATPAGTTDGAAAVCSGGLADPGTGPT